MQQELEPGTFRTRQRAATNDDERCLLSDFVQQMRSNGNPSLSGILVSGYSDTGKTLLVESYLEGLKGTHAILIARHHQQHQNIPYFGFKYAISDYLTKIYNQSGKVEFNIFSERLKSYLGASFFLLIDYIPELSLIFGRDAVVPPMRSHLTIENQLYPLFKHLFEFLADLYKEPVFLFTDDLQWVDASGANLLKYLLLNLSGTQLIWIGACRAPQTKVSLLRQLIEELRFKEKKVETIFLKELNREEGGLLQELTKLSASAYDVICMMACLGRFNRQIILDWLHGDTSRLKELLAEGIKAGLLKANGQEVRFSEMHVGEMVYNDLSEARKSKLHYEIANLFYSRGLERLNSTDVIMMTSSFNQSLAMVKADGRLQLLAELNYKSAKLLQQDKAFDEACNYFKMSADLLKECSWEIVSEQVWLVYMDRAKIEYYLGEYDLAEIHLDYLLRHITEPLKRAKVFELKVTINNHLARYQKVVWILREGLAELGVELPFDEQPLLDEVNRLKIVLERHENEPVDHLPDDNDALVSEAILRLLYVGGMSLHHTSDVLMTWAALQIILRANRESPSVVKAIGYVSYGRMLIISGDIKRGFEFGSKGLAINMSMNDVTLRCRVFGVYAFYIQPWMKDFSESKHLLEAAAVAGQHAGDLIGLYILKTHQLNLHLLSGLPLKGLSQWDFEESYPGMELTYYITHYQKSLISFLTGEASVFSIPRQNPSSLAGRLTIQEEKFYRHYVWARYYFLFGHYELAARSAEEAHANRKLQEASPLLPANLMIWFLSVTQNWYGYSDETCKELTPRINEVLESFEAWKDYAPGNYLPSWLLMKAEWYRITGEGEHTLQYYQKSFDVSGTNIYHRAITSELWAKYLLTKNARDVHAIKLLSTSIDSFNEWNAVAKSKQLIQQFDALLCGANQPLQTIDIETIQYELSGDMEVRSLVKKLMVLLLRISGSSHVVVELVEGTGDRILYDHLSLLPEGDEKQASMPKSMMLMALKSQNVVIVNELTTERGLRDVDALQIRRVQSFLILPVTINGDLSMVIYLENVFAKNWYLADRVKSVRITANQGAVMIENARIHEHSVRLNREIRREMIEKERLSSVIEAQKDSHLKALMQAQDNDRKRIASDLHDSLGSLLSSVRLRFNGLQDEFLLKVPEKAQRFSDSLKLLDEAIEELRQIAHTMVPVSLSRFGLRSALQSFVEQVSAAGQLDIHLQILGLEGRLPEVKEVLVFRICQELVQNVIKHAQATTMRLQIILHNDSLNIMVEDNGVGLIKDSIPRGLGFSTIQSNVDLFKGTFDIESQPGKGCLVLIDLPVGIEN
jgi:signal transduction histidine kinase/predicted ATPase